MTVLITGATGNLGRKLRKHLEGRYPLRLLDRDARGDSDIHVVDLEWWEESWIPLFEGVSVVIHLAGNPVAHAPLEEVWPANWQGTTHVYEAALAHKVPRVVYASSNHVMGGYKDDGGGMITVDCPVKLGTSYTSDNVLRRSHDYARTKLRGETLGARCAKLGLLTVVAVRLGWVWRGDNTPEGLPRDREDWFRRMWLSDRDFCHLMECCITADLVPGSFHIINGMSNNTGMRWDLSNARRDFGYNPQDDVGA
jgi:nucleoside-diphosphate-sugar epimerase